MSEKTNVVQSFGPSLSSMLFITFLVLKLTGVITWSWWWITAPLWVPFAAIMAVLAVFLSVFIVSSVGLWLLKK